MLKYKDIMFVSIIIILSFLVFESNDIIKTQNVEYQKIINKKYEEIEIVKQKYKELYNKKYEELLKKEEELNKQKERLDITENIMNETTLDYKAVETLINESINKEIPINIMLGLMEYESNFDPENKNPNSTATGLGQFLHSTARWVAEKNDISFKIEYLTNPSYNIKLIALYLSHLYKEKGSWKEALQGYGDQTPTYYRRVFDRSVKYSNYNFDIMFYLGQLER